MTPPPLSVGAASPISNSPALQRRPLLRRKFVSVCVLWLLAACVPPPATTYIHEFPHPRLVVHYHPVTGEQFALSHVQFALTSQAHAIELDLHYRASDGEVVVNHDSATAASPTLSQVVQLIVQQAAGDGTVNHDGRQFFLVLEPKQNDNRLFDGIVRVLSGYTAYLSTAVGRTDPPRGITVVITGSYLQSFQSRFASPQLNQLCIVEGRDYGPEITNLSGDQFPFQWVESIQSPNEQARINALHTGTDPRVPGKFNVRIWDCHAELRACLASGADEINVDRNELLPFEQQLLHQDPRGESPSLSVQGSQALLAWRGASGTNLYTSLGTLDAAGLHFSRQILLTYLLRDTPRALAPASALLKDGRLLIAYEGTTAHWLAYVAGAFTSFERFVTFAGEEHLLTVPNANGRRGSNPALAIGPDGRIVIVYEGTASQGLWYLSGFLSPNGEFTGEEYSLTEGDARRGTSPAIAINRQNQVIVAYRGTADEKLWYVSGSIDAAGRIRGSEFSLTEGNARRGYAPSVAFSPDNRVVIAYEGTGEQKLWYVTGTLDPGGRIAGTEFSLTEGDTRRGSHPAVAFDTAGNMAIVYQGTGDKKIWYVHGRLDPSGWLAGQEALLDMSMDRR